jgi:hypothetical protein
MPDNQNHNAGENPTMDSASFFGSVKPHIDKDPKDCIQEYIDGLINGLKEAEPIHYKEILVYTRQEVIQTDCIKYLLQYNIYIDNAQLETYLKQLGLLKKDQLLKYAGKLESPHNRP